MNKIYVKLKNEEIIEIDNSDNYTPHLLLKSLSGTFIRIYDYIFKCDEIIIIRIED
jgi:hypothetical protein